MAQQWAEHLASIKTLKHSNQKYRGQPVGENVAAKTGTGQPDYTGQSLYTVAQLKWYVPTVTSKNVSWYHFSWTTL